MMMPTYPVVVMAVAVVVTGVVGRGMLVSVR